MSNACELSGWTIFYRFVFPALRISGFATATLSTFVFSKAPTDPRSPLAFHLSRARAFGVHLLGLQSAQARCALRYRDLVSNYWIETAIPFSASFSLFMSPELVWLRFRGATTFGTKIVFMVNVRLLLGFIRHPMIRELQELPAQTH